MKKWLAAALAAGLVLNAAIAVAQTVGPAGEAATPSAEVTLTDADIAALKDKGYKGRVANTSGGSYHPAKAGIFMLC